MIQQLHKVGDSNALLLDKPILELLGLAEDGQVELVIHDGSLIVTPVHPSVVEPERFEACLDQVVSERRDVLRRLAQ
jgi:antitoxin component of MazEF toxin-antitoxin module